MPPLPWQRIGIALVLLLAAALRLAELNRQSIWFDEAATIHIVTRPTFVEMMTRIRADERTPPLHYIVLRYWMKLFGDSEFSVRLPSALATVASVWVLYSLTRGLFGASEALIAALLLATSRFHILFAAEARAYSFLLLLGLLSCDLFIRLLTQRNRRIELAYVLITAAMLYAHLYGVFVIAAQWLAWALHHRRELIWRRWLVLNLAVLALFSPWIAIAIEWSRSVAQGIWAKPVTLYDIVAAYRTLCASLAMLIALIIFAAIGIWKSPQHRRGMTLLLALATLPVIVPVTVSVLTRPNFSPRYAIIAPAAVFALASLGVAALRARALVILAAIVLAALALVGREADWRKPDWRSAAAFLEANLKSGDVVVINRKNATYLYDYYVDRPDIRRIGFDSATLPLSDDHVYQRIWLVLHGDLFTPEQILAAGNWQIVSRHAFDHVLILQFAPAHTAVNGVDRTGPYTDAPHTGAL